MFFLFLLSIRRLFPVFHFRSRPPLWFFVVYSIYLLDSNPGQRTQRPLSHHILISHFIHQYLNLFAIFLLYSIWNAYIFCVKFLRHFLGKYLKGQSSKIFDLQFFSSFGPAWVTDQWVKVFSILVKFSLRYSNFC